MSATVNDSPDVVVVGGGHNGLTAAAYLGRAGYSVTVLEKLDRVGGAAVSARAFAGREAWLSRYSYLVSLMPQSIRDDLGLDLKLIRRRYSSYTPVPGGSTGLLIDSHDPQRTRASFESIGAGSDYDRWLEFYRDTQILAECLFPTMTQPLLRRDEVRSLLETRAPGRALFERFIDTPIRTLVQETFDHDLVRGVVLTDALIGTFPESWDDPALNRCFVYHVIGGGTGDWDVPVGGMGSVSGALESAVRRAGVHIVTGAEVVSIDPGGPVVIEQDGHRRELVPRLIVSGIARQTLDALVDSSQAAPAVEGAQVKVNLLLHRLPTLRDQSVSPAEAFSGTFHINETDSQLATSVEQAHQGAIPSPIPCEIYCHSLSDRSILGDGLHGTDAHTLTVFALNVPHRLIQRTNPDTSRAELQQRVLDSLNNVLAEPISDCVMTDANGELCIETKTTSDLEHALGLPGGNIFHEPLSWPFAEADQALHTPAQRWGVDSGYGRIVLAGSSAVRGGGVSGIGGHNAAMASLEILGSV